MNRLVLLAITLISLLSGCEQEIIPVRNITFDISGLSLNIDSSAIITPVFEPEGAYDRVEWSSRSPHIASVDEYGKVTAHQLGRTTITATVNNNIATCDVDVIPHIYSSGTKVVLDGTNVLYTVNEHTKVRADQELNVYTASGVSTGTMQVSYKVYKNGKVLYTLHNSTPNSDLTAFELIDQNLYTVIDVHDIQSSSYSSSRVYKNGKLYHLFSVPYSDISIKSVFADKGDVYCGGYIYDGRHTATIWKNKEVLYTLHNSPYSSWVKSIATDGNDIYSLVCTNDLNRNNLYYVYKNDTPIFFTDKYTQCTNLIVKEGHYYLVLGTPAQITIFVDGVAGKILDRSKLDKTASLFLYESVLCGDDLYTLALCGLQPAIWRNQEIMYTFGKEYMYLESLYAVP